jgi:hypothetical protein
MSIFLKKCFGLPKRFVCLMVARAHTGLDIAVVAGGVESQHFIRCHIHSGKNHIEIFRFTGGIRQVESALPA